MSVTAFGVVMDHQMVCTICHEPFGGDKRSYYSLGCGHEFHEECAVGWAKHIRRSQNDSDRTVPCPACREPWLENEVQGLKGTLPAASPQPPSEDETMDDEEINDFNDEFLDFIETRDSWTNLAEARAAFYEYVDVYMADVNYRQGRPLYSAIHADNAPALRVLLAAGADVSRVFINENGEVVIVRPDYSDTLVANNILRIHARTLNLLIRAGVHATQESVQYARDHGFENIALILERAVPRRDDAQ
jgi:Ring finger domain